LNKSARRKAGPVWGREIETSRSGYLEAVAARYNTGPPAQEECTAPKSKRTAKNLHRGGNVLQLLAYFGLWVNLEGGAGQTSKHLGGTKKGQQLNSALPIMVGSKGKELVVQN